MLGLLSRAIAGIDADGIGGLGRAEDEAGAVAAGHSREPVAATGLSGRAEQYSRRAYRRMGRTAHLVDVSGPTTPRPRGAAEPQLLTRRIAEDQTPLEG
jgi:glycerate-2-kinase